MTNIIKIFKQIINVLFTLISTSYALTSLYIVSFVHLIKKLVYHIVNFIGAASNLLVVILFSPFIIVFGIVYICFVEPILNYDFYQCLKNIALLPIYMLLLPFYLLAEGIKYLFNTIVGLFETNTNIQINNNQSTHTASVHQSASKSAKELSKKYGTAIEGELANELVEMLKNDISNLTRNDFVSEKQISAAIRCIDRLMEPSTSFTDKTSDLSIIQLLALTYEAAKDENYRNNILQDYLEAITLGLYEIQRGYNLNDNGIDDNKYDSPICPGGSFNKLIEKMVGILPDCSMVFINADSINIKLLSLIRASINNTFKYPGKITIDNKNLFTKSYDSKNAVATTKYLHYNDESILNKVQKNIKKSLNDEFGNALGQCILKNNYTIHQYIEDGIDQEESYLFEILNDELVEKFKENKHINNQISEKSNFLNGYNIFVFILMISFVIAITASFLAPYFVASTLVNNIINIAIGISLISLSLFVEGLFNKRISSAFFNKEISFFETILLSCVHLNYNLNLFQILSLKKEKSITFEQLLRFNSGAKDALEIEHIEFLFKHKDLSFEQLNQLNVNARQAIEIGNIRALFINKQLSFEHLNQLNYQARDALEIDNIKDLYLNNQLSFEQLKQLNYQAKDVLKIDNIRAFFINKQLSFEQLNQLNYQAIDALKINNIKALFINKQLSFEQLNQLNYQARDTLKINTIKNLFENGNLTIKQLKEIDPKLKALFENKKVVDSFKNQIITFNSIKEYSVSSNYNPQTLFRFSIFQKTNSRIPEQDLRSNMSTALIG
ncbi:MAG: hypothetical protein P8L77_03250 [Gammaproteobacteria bacterium]|nr:hypothetical protein [Gammaproteobacteria bacterium]